METEKDKLASACVTLCNYSLTCVQLFETSQTVAHQAPLSLEFSRQEYWSGLPLAPPGDLPNPGIEPQSPALRANALPTKLLGKPYFVCYYHIN